MTPAGRKTTKPNANAPLRALAFAAAAVPVLILAELPFLSNGAAGALPAWALIATTGCLLTVAGLWIGLNRVGRRIDELGEVVEAVSQGRYDVEIPVPACRCSVHCRIDWPGSPKAWRERRLRPGKARSCP